MSPDEIKALRRRLGMTARALAEALRVDVDLVTDWERAVRFPTRRHVSAMSQLQLSPALPAQDQPNALPAVLQEPRLWALVGKLAANPELAQAVYELADRYPSTSD
jgi:transcriptional regulator with XRE-family HTH domain